MRAVSVRRTIPPPRRPLANLARMPRAVAVRRRLGRLGALDANSLMTQGNLYVFHFAWTGLVNLSPSMAAIAQQIASSDSNFGSPVATKTANGVDVYFTYKGGGSTIQAAGGEMENVINTFGLMGFSSASYLSFVNADGGGAPQQAGQTPITPPPNGNSDDSSLSSFPWMTLIIIGGIAFTAKSIFG